MAVSNYNYTYASSLGIPTQVKYVDYYLVAGGGGGGRPSTPPGWGRNATAGGNSCLYNVMGAGGGGPGQISSGGYGGWGNYNYGQNGWVNYSNSEYSRAQSGYPPKGYGGAGQWRSGYISGGGGGGGASYTRACRGNQGAIPGQNVSWSIGAAGVQGGTGYRRFGDGGAIYIAVTTWNPVSASLSANPATILAGQSTDLQWAAGGEWQSASLDNGIGNLSGGSGTYNVSPTVTTTYTLTVSNSGYNQSASYTVQVYVPPVITLSTNYPSGQLILGQSAELSWSVTGDYSNLTIEPGIGSGLPGNSSTTVTPTTTTTYTATATGLGGTASESITLEVIQPPTLAADGPPDVDFGVPYIPFNISGTNSDTGVTATASYFDGYSWNLQSPILIPGTADSDVFNVTQWQLPITWDDDLPAPFGPRRVEVTFVNNGHGGLTNTEVELVIINIDESPLPFSIPASEEKLKDEDPVITPDDTITTETIQITDIDIPVEIKSSQPIQVEFSTDPDVWHEVRSL